MKRKIKKIPNLDKANKLIFVKEYQEAEALIEELVKSPEHENEVLIHLRRIELATKLNILSRIHREYEEKVAADSSNVTAQICYTLVEQHGEYSPIKETLAHLKSLLTSIGPHPAIYYGIGFAMEIEGNWQKAQYNYEQCVNLDPSWYPGYFGLSQVFYQLGDEKRGDHNFFLFEEAAPYNVYGNFETHRKLSIAYLQEEKYELAERAITTLSDWWVDNKGHCPLEIQVYEKFALAKIADHAGDSNKSDRLKNQGTLQANRILNDKDTNEGILFFVARALEEFGEITLAIEFYKAILRLEARSPELVQRIGSQFFSMGEYRLALEIFEEAYEHHPDHPEVRFCLLVAKLRLAGVNVEEYLIGKERLKSLLEASGDRVEILSLLHSLVAMFPHDPDIQTHMGDIYYKLGNEDRAAQHFQNMFDWDHKSQVSRLKYAAFKIQIEDYDGARGILDTISTGNEINESHLCEVLWLKANYETYAKNFEEALRLLNRVLNYDPWNVVYIVQKIICLSLKIQDKVSFQTVDSVIKKLSKSDETDLDWKEFEETSNLFSQANYVELVYERERIKFLYTDGDNTVLNQLIQAARRYDASKSTYDFLRLLNTNFDSPDIYWSLGMLFKELWQLESSRVWFEQMLRHPRINDQQKGKSYLEIADCYIWEGRDLDKSIEFARLALDLFGKPNQKALRVLAHGLLKKGQVRQAEVYLEDINENEDMEVVYLKGLVNYRNGAFEKANKIWKPLLTTRTESLRFHNIKQEIMKYYFDKKPYQNTN